MDPRTTYRDMLDALRAGDVDDAFQAALDLKQWRLRGGYLNEEVLAAANSVVCVASHVAAHVDGRTFDVMA